MKKEREYHGCVKEYNKEKRKQYHIFFNIKAVGKNIKGGRGLGNGKFWEENQEIKKK